MMIPPDSPHELSGFPEVSAVHDRYYKVHLADTEASYFGNSSLYHFDPPPQQQREFGTCYMATSREGAFLETLGGIRPLSQRHVDARVITEMYTPGGLRIADFTWGDVSGLDDCPITQRWAKVLYEAGFNGVQYKPNHDLDWPTYWIFALWSEPGIQHDVVKSDGPQRITDLRTLRRLGLEILDEEPLAVGGSTPERESEDECAEEADTD
ncbi:MAG TPA: RES family NAD+ phosphorylase [Streptosporangiaceae bacterium]|nr:RES family NAD+ phosphorylase [Streptosporangiaceae bacterium]